MKIIVRPPMRLKILIAIISSIFCSCSTYEIADKHVSKKFTKNDLVLNEFKTDNFNINYWDSKSDKPVLIMLHGFGTPARFQWFDQVKVLSKDYRVIFPNLIYFGGSMSSKEDFTVDYQVKAIEALISHLKIDTFNLGGVSYGGLVAAELTVKNKEKVKKLVIIDSPIKYLSQKDIDNVCNIYEVNNFVELLMPHDHFGLKNIIGIAFYKPPHMPAFMLKGAHENIYSINIEEKKNLLHHLVDNRTNFESSVYDFDCPTLFIWGEGDQLIPPTAGEQLQKHVGNNSKLIIIPKTAHMPNLEKPKEFNEIIMEFLKE